MTPDKDPSTYGLITYLWVTGLAAWGGLVNFYRKVKSGETRAFNVVELIGEIATSAFAVNADLKLTRFPGGCRLKTDTPLSH